MGRGREKQTPEPDFDGRTNLWTRQKFDTDKSWRAFEMYRIMGAERTLEAVAKDLRVSPTHIETWSRKHSWRRRVRAWDEHEAEVARRARLKRIEKLNAEMAVTAEAMWKLAAKDLQGWHEKLTKAANEGQTVLAPNELRRLAETGMRLHRLVEGEAESRNETTGATFAQIAASAEDGEDDGE